MYLLCIELIFTSLANRRLDEWVPEDRIDRTKRSNVEQVPKAVDEIVIDGDSTTDRKITRNQKRKHDEINHVQKVCSCKIFPVVLNG